MKALSKIILSLVVLLGVSMAPVFADEDEHERKGRVPYPVIAEPMGEKCVEPEEVMKRKHMDFIMHQRDETMHEGIRGIKAKYSLKQCIACHVQKDAQGNAIPVNAKDQFCESCHNYAAVNIDCFSCHRTTPGEGK